MTFKSGSGTVLMIIKSEVKKPLWKIVVADISHDTL
jgi:hypothetical protein